MSKIKITPLYERLSRDDELQGESNSISNDDVIYKGGLHHRKLHHDCGSFVANEKTVMMKEGMPLTLTVTVTPYTFPQRRPLWN